MRTMKILGLGVLLAAGSYEVAFAQEVPAVDASIQFVITGGYWSTDRGNGTYRVIVQQVGWEHVASRVVVQWLTTDEGARGHRVLESKVVVDPAVDGPWSFTSPELIRRNAGIDLALEGTHTQALSDGEFVFQLSGPGKVQVVKRGL